MGPMLTAKDRDRVLQLIKAAEQDGAKIVCGGKIFEQLTRGFFLEPTILRDVRQDMQLARAGVFGPVLQVLSPETRVRADVTPTWQERRLTMKSQFPQEILERIDRCGLIAVLVIDDPVHARPLAGALLNGGIDTMELTLRTPAAMDALRAIRRDVPDMLAGVGTILTPEQVEDVLEAGAAFGVSPGCNQRVVEHARARGLPFAPGVATPSDMEAAIEVGCRELKFFPAESMGGMKHLSSMMAPYAHLGLRFIPLGGLNARNMTTYLADPAIVAIGGSWIASRELIRQEDWKAITANAAEARGIIDSHRKATAP